MVNEKNNKSILLILNIFLIILIFCLDIVVPLYIPIWLLYLIPLVIVSWNLTAANTYLLTLLSSILTFSDYVLMPENSRITYNFLLLDKFLAILIIWVLVIFLGHRKRTLQSLRQTSGLLETIFNNTHLLYVYVDRNFQILKVNKAFNEVMKKDETELIGKNYFDVLPFESQRMVFNEVLKSGNPHFNSGLSFPIPEKSNILNLEDSEKEENLPANWDLGLVPVKDDDGKVTGLILSLSDASKRVKTERALIENQARLNGIISSAMDAIISIDKNQKIILFNAAAEKMFKIKAPEALGRHINTFIPDKYKELHKEHVKSFGNTNVSMRSMGKLGSVVGLRTDGVEFPIEASISQIDTGSEKIYTVILRDITQRRQIEEQIKNQKMRAEILADASKELSEVSLDFDTVLNVVSKRIIELVGGVCIIRLINEDKKLLEPTAFYHNDSENSDYLREILFSSPIPVEYSLFSKVLETGKSLFFPEADNNIIEEYIYRPDNTSDLKRVDINSLLIVPLKAQNHIAGTLEVTKSKNEGYLNTEDKILVKDISDRAALAILNAKNYAEKLYEIEERKRVEENLLNIKQELERSNSELEQFAYIASHDLQEPLRMVASYVQLLERRYKDKLDDSANDFIDFAVDGANRMQKLINDLLAYSRVSSRKKQFVLTDLNSALEAALKNLKLIIEETGAVIQKEELPTIFADSTQMEQLFQNLIGNAIKFRGNKTPEIKIGKEILNNKWLFYIKDNGIGIDEQYKELIFVIFQRLHQSTYPGTGIGLAVCKKIVERHGGNIWVESSMGNGSTFYFTMPKKENYNL